MTRTKSILLLLLMIIGGWYTGRGVVRDFKGLPSVPTAQAQTNATPPLYWSNWAKVYSSTTSDFTTTATSNIYDASNQPNLTVAVYSSTGVTAYTIAVETAPFSIAGANWANVTTIDYTDDGSVASPKWQQVNIPGRYGKVRIRITAITPGAGSVQVYLAT